MRGDLLSGSSVVVPYTLGSIASQAAATTFRTLGTGVTPQNLFTLENGAGSGVTVVVRRLEAAMDSIAVLTGVAPVFITWRCTVMPTGGAPLAKALGYTRLLSKAAVVARGATASDGGGAAAITASGDTRIKTSMQPRMHTLVGQVYLPAINLMPSGDVVLREGEAVLVQIVAAAAGSNPSTNHYYVNADWIETVPA